MARTFRIVETLGTGAFGAVHLAEIDAGEGLVQRLAVKWLHPQWSHDGELLGRLRDEARLLALLNHDHVVHVHGLTRMGGRLAILMEAIDGVDLSRFEGTPIPPRAALEILERISDALDAAWNTVNPGTGAPLRVVHRDIKPSNVMITARGGVKVMDFGVARATFDSREAQTRGQQYGTARYMAPERWLHGVADAPSDIFSLGITAIEVLSGTAVERPRLSKEGFVEDIDAACARVPSPGVQELIRRMTAFEPKDRPTASQVAEACRALAAHEPEPGLRTWAATVVVQLRASRPADPHDGAVVLEDTSAETFDTAVTLGEPTAATPVPTRTESNRFGVPEPRPRARWREIAAISVLVPAGGLLFALAWVQAVGGERVPPATKPLVADAEAPPPGPAYEAGSFRADASPPVKPEAPAGPASEAEAPKTDVRPESKPDSRPKGNSKADPVEDAPAASPEPEKVLVKLTIPAGLSVSDGEQTIAPGRWAYNYPKGEMLELVASDGKKMYPCTADPSKGQVVFAPDGSCKQ